MLKVMIDALKENGVITNSIYREGFGSWKYFKKDDLEQIDFKTITISEEKTYWKIGAYKKC
jgi:hypothetical protein